MHLESMNNIPESPLGDFELDIYLLILKTWGSECMGQTQSFLWGLDFEPQALLFSNKKPSLCKERKSSVSSNWRLSSQELVNLLATKSPPQELQIRARQIQPALQEGMTRPQVSSNLNSLCE